MGSLLSVLDVRRYYEVRRSVFSVEKEIVKAVDGVSFELEAGRTLGVVGESGSGKSTLARCLMFLERPDSGKITFDGVDLLNAGPAEIRKIRRKLQIIFQDPYSSLNPRMTVRNIIAEPLKFHHMVNGSEDLNSKVIEILKSVGINDDFLKKYPHEMSGGQRQRVAIGRALATEPALVIADEPVSSLDVSIQAQIINLFIDIREQLNISMVFVSHDLNIVRFISDRILVLYKGKVVEMGERDQIFLNPLHPYTKMLIEASRGEFFLKNEKSSGHQKTGCVFYDKCSQAKDMCKTNIPDLKGSEAHRTACFQS
ncbi:MAG: putative oligopeptide transporter ATP-binding protein [Deltaproteobacteria bacterium]|nr:putative oligopeptide transporter ATP-binding protein [Deltaproteobacteria bacterium]